jgi:plasmid stabilization system protein ParE
VALAYRIKARARREIEKAAEWWAHNRLAAPGAVRVDIEEALAILVDQPALGARVETGRPIQVRRFFLDRTKYHLYYRIRGAELEVLSLWHSSPEQGPSI